MNVCIWSVLFICYDVAYLVYIHECKFHECTTCPLWYFNHRFTQKDRESQRQKGALLRCQSADSMLQCVWTSLQTFWYVCHGLWFFVDAFVRGAVGGCLYFDISILGGYIFNVSRELLIQQLLLLSWWLRTHLREYWTEVLVQMIAGCEEKTCLFTLHYRMWGADVFVYFT